MSTRQSSDALLEVPNKSQVLSVLSRCFQKSDNSLSIFKGKHLTNNDFQTQAESSWHVQALMSVKQQVWFLNWRTKTAKLWASQTDEGWLCGCRLHTAHLFLSVNMVLVDSKCSWQHFWPILFSFWGTNSSLLDLWVHFSPQMSVHHWNIFRSKLVSNYLTWNQVVKLFTHLDRRLTELQVGARVSSLSSLWATPSLGFHSSHLTPRWHQQAQWDHAAVINELHWLWSDWRCSVSSGAPRCCIIPTLLLHKIELMN